MGLEVLERVRCGAMSAQPKASKMCLKGAKGREGEEAREVGRGECGRGV